MLLYTEAAFQSTTKVAKWVYCDNHVKQNTILSGLMDDSLFQSLITLMNNTKIQSNLSQNQGFVNYIPLHKNNQKITNRLKNMNCIKFYLTSFVIIVISIVLINCNRMIHEYDEPLMDSTNSDYMTDIPSGELWFKRVHEHRFNKKNRLPISVKRPQKSANYYYDLYRQSMLPTNEFLG
ncbi:unnamed protein product [Schistosoma intercalatum]|nr:unnamed protein product [Schistosoma intercalatum]